MLISELIYELQERLELYGDKKVAAHYESDFTPYFVQGVSVDNDDDTGDVTYIEIIIDDETS